MVQIILGLRVFWAFQLSWACMRYWNLWKACGTNVCTWNCERGAFLIVLRCYACSNFQIHLARYIFAKTMAELKHIWLCPCYCIKLCQEKCPVVLASPVTAPLAWLPLCPKNLCLVQRLAWAWDRSQQAVWLWLFWLGKVGDFNSINTLCQKMDLDAFSVLVEL